MVCIVVIFSLGLGHLRFPAIFPDFFRFLILTPIPRPRWPGPRQSSTQRSTTGRSASDLFQMTTYIAADSCPYCDDGFSLYPLAFTQLSKAWFLVPASAKAASCSHSYKSRKRSLSLSFLVSLDPEGGRLAEGC